jgi:hypothetical protein
MRRPFRVRDIAVQAGLSEMTVDRVLNERAGVSVHALDRRCAVFVGHDLDEDNLRLLRQGRVSVVLHHDLGQDMRRACQAILQAHGALPGAPHSLPSNIQVITPYNTPARLPEVTHHPT